MTPKRAATINRRLLWVLAAAVLLLSLQLSASAQTWTVIHSFNGQDGRAPAEGLTRDAGGNFYGTTSGGGWGGVTEAQCIS